MTSLDAGGGDLELRDYVDVLRRRKVLFLLTLVTVAALSVTAQQLARPAPTYTSTATVLIESPTAAFSSNGTANASNASASMQTEAVMASSQPVAKLAAKEMRTSDQAAALRGSASVSVVPDTQLLNVSYTDTTPELARAGADAYATAFLTFRAQQISEVAERRTAVLTGEIERLQERVTQLTKKIRALSEEDAEVISLEATRTTLIEQMAQLQSYSVEGRTNASSVGTLLEPASAGVRHESPAGRQRVIAASSGLAGLLVALVTVFVRDRLDRRVFTAAEAVRITAAPVLGQLAYSRRRRPEQLELEDQSLRRLRTAVVAATERRRARSLLITSPVDNRVSMAALRLAASLAQSGKSVALMVVGDRREALVDFFRRADVEEIRVTAGATSIPIMRHRDTGLDIVMVSRSRTPDPLLHPGTLADTIDRLGEIYETVLIDAPAVLESADVFDCATVTHGVVLVVRLRSNRKIDLADASVLFQRTGSDVVGLIIETMGPQAGAVTPEPDVDAPPVRQSIRARATVASNGRPRHSTTARAT